MKKFGLLTICGALLIMVLTACSSSDVKSEDNLDKITSIEAQFKNEYVTVDKKEDIERLYPILDASKLEQKEDYSYDSKGWVYSLVVKREGMDDQKISIISNDVILIDGVAYNISSLDIKVIETIDEITNIERK
jgi:hypothetical protein